MTGKQLAFELPLRAALGRDNFFQAPPNRVALATIENWQNWPGGKMVLSGPSGSGKTHLAHVWAELSGGAVIPARGLSGLALPELAAKRAVAVEDVDQIAGADEDEAALFHLHNMVLAEGGRLLMTGRGAASKWRIALPDLASRIQGSAAVALAAPDDALLAAVMMKLFSDRQLVVPPNVLDFLLLRMERSFDEVHRIVEILDRHALAQGRAVTRKLASEILDNQADKGA